MEPTQKPMTNLDIDLIRAGWQTSRTELEVQALRSLRGPRVQCILCRKIAGSMRRLAPRGRALARLAFPSVLRPT